METATLKYPQVKNYFAGKFQPNGHKQIEVICPLNGEVISTVPLSSAKDLDEAVEAAKAAFPSWSAVPIKERVQVFYKYKTLLEKHRDELAMLVHEENGKTMDESYAEVDKSIELTEFACSLPQLIAGREKLLIVR